MQNESGKQGMKAAVWITGRVVGTQGDQARRLPKERRHRSLAGPCVGFETGNFITSKELPNRFEM